MSSLQTVLLCYCPAAISHSLGWGMSMLSFSLPEGTEVLKWLPLYSVGKGKLPEASSEEWDSHPLSPCKAPASAMGLLKSVPTLDSSPT